MNIETFILAHQEGRIIEYTMKHYTQFSDVVLLEGHSTDKTVEIAEAYGAKIVKVDTGDKVDDTVFTNLKNNCWKDSRADWVIICDADEFVYRPNIVDYLEKTDATIFMPRLFNMFSEVFPTTKGQIYDEVKLGKEGGSKMNLFKPSEIKEIGYGFGCHEAYPSGNVKLNISSDILTLHMRHLSVDYVVKRNAYLNSRRSEENKKHGWGFHLESPPEAVKKYFRNEMTKAWPVIR